ncbi:MAG: PEP/pyruvate-binding domain-containing protein [Bryobacteraceae bacterium]
MSQWIAWLDGEGDASPEVLGGKGSRLAAMARAGFPVPAGFCVTTRADWEAAPALEEAIRQAWRRLGVDSVAVRSSATTEDLPSASFAGQQDTYLSVRGEEAVLDAVARCRESLWNERAVAYRNALAADAEQPRMAVVVQTMIPADVAGVAFSMDPVTGAARPVIECTTGSGPLRQDLARQLTKALAGLERLFGGPQDIEWGFWEDRLYLFQSRPVTACATGFFTEDLPGDDHLWTSGFLNERFPQPVSPLGWTLIRELLEPLAIRDPLRFLGYRPPENLPLTKLYQGHPYVNVHVFQVLYKRFPKRLLPEDARRYFPEGNTDLRKQAAYPSSLLNPRIAASLLWNFLRDPANCSPFHNFRVWERFTLEHDAAMAALVGGEESVEDLWRRMERAQALNARLLAIHRWSLTHADVLYSLLRRSLGGDLAARLVAGLPNKSVELNAALAAVKTESDWRAFCEAYGHRSFSLDIYRPTFAETPEEVLRLASGGERERPRLQVRQRTGAGLGTWLIAAVQRYMILREEQRFYWQKTLALQRTLALRMGRLLPPGEDIFFATMDELRHAARGSPLPQEAISRRKAEFIRLERSAGADYPAFLRGSQPVWEQQEEGDVLCGQPVSPGTARGAARVLLTPRDLDSVAAGEVLVTRGIDPGWTVVFGRIAALVTETGGQLSHGSVVAREYGLPMVTGVQGATRMLKDGQLVEVNGTAGLVRMVKEYS